MFSYAPRIPTTTLSGLPWHALLPHVERRAPQGRPLKELRKRMDAIFRLVAAGLAGAVLDAA